MRNHYKIKPSALRELKHIRGLLVGKAGLPDTNVEAGRCRGVTCSPRVIGGRDFMKKHRKQRTEGIKKAPAAAEKSRRSELSHHFSWITVALWIFLTVLLVVLKNWAEKHTDAGRYVTEATYNWLQFKIAPKEQAASDIVVVDLSEVPLTGSPPHTDRKKLQELVDAVLVHKPKAVGLDVDFSPAPCGDRDPACDSKTDRRFLFPAEDPAFLEFCLRNRTEARPIVVGITTSVVKGRTSWLGNPRYADLAAFIERPNGAESFFANPEMDLWVAGPNTQPKDEIGRAHV